MKHLKALLALVVGAVVLWLFWIPLSGHLYRGSDTPESSKLLNKMEKEGVPGFSLTTIEGKPLTLDQFNGKVVILNFWASWCDPCVAEFPSLLSLIEHYKGEVVLVAVSADEKESDVQSFLKAFKANSEHLYIAMDKDKQLAQKYGTVVLPESYIIGHDRKLIRKIAGVDDWYTPEAISYFKDLISVNNKQKTISD